MLCHRSQDKRILRRRKNGKNGINGRDGEKGEKGDDGSDGLNAPGSLDGQLEPGFVIVTEYLEPNTGKDLSGAIQNIIDTNPNRVIYFPDGEYMVKSPIKTSAKYDKSVSLLLSNYAEIKAMDSWTGGSTDAIIMLGAAESYNNVSKPGSNYYLSGGIINGNGKANGVSIDSGRETRVENVSIKNAKVGLHIKDGVNSHSSDADIKMVNIVGNDTKDSVGVLIEGCDNTLQNMRITGVKIGVHLKRGGNFLRDIHPLIGNMSLYSGSIGFYNQSGGNWYDVCYSDQFETAFKVDGSKSIFTNCYSYWWYNNEAQGTNKVSQEIGFHFVEKFNATIQNTRIQFTSLSATNSYMKVNTAGGTGTVFNPIMDDGANEDNTYKSYLVLSGNN